LQELYYGGADSMGFGAGIFRLGRQVAAVFMVLVTVLFALPGDAEAQTYRFSSFDVQGTQRVDASTVLTFAAIPRNETVTAGQLNDARQRLQNSTLFETVDVVPRGSVLVIIVQEYPTINRINIEGNRRLDDEDLLPLLSSQPRRVYSPAQAEADAAEIIEAYQLQGRLAATVVPLIIRRSENRVDLVFDVTEGRVVETERIAFVGNRAYSDRRLRRTLESTQAGLFRNLIRTDTFIADRVAFDQQLLTDFYRERGYIDFVVQSTTSELSRERNAFFVTFNIREGQSFSIGQITTVTDVPGIDADEYQAVIRLRSGVTYSPRLVDNTITRLENLATQQGLRFIRVEPRLTRNDETLTLDVEFNITRGDRVFVERIDIEGNATTMDRVIRRQFRTAEGDPLDPREIRQGAERIRALGFFADAQVAARPGSSEGQVIVDVDVEETPTGSLGFGASFSTDSGVGLNVSFSERNFLGRGQSLSFGFDTSEATRSFSFSFSEPAFLGREVTFGFSANYTTTESDDATFDTLNYGIRPSFGFPLSSNSRIGVFYSYSLDSILDVPATSSPILIAEAGEFVTSSIGYNYVYDTRSSGLNPNAGLRFRFGQEFAGVGGDREYIITTASATAETAILREEVSLRATLEGGALNMLSGNSRVTERFRLNSRQLRGFEPNGVGPRDLTDTSTDDDALGGNYYVVARFETAFPIGLPEEYGVSGGLFYDIGAVWGLDNTVGLGGPVDDGLNLRQAIGFSIFWDTQIGPLRFNFSRVLDAEAYDLTRSFDFTIEARF
jgi:outer membrane protein insertion porin family